MQGGGSASQVPNLKENSSPASGTVRGPAARGLCDTGRVQLDEFQHGIQLFNAANFFEAHEVLEEVWRAAPAPERKFLQGLIQVAVALHHHSRGNTVGCRSLLARASRNLSAYPVRHAGLDLTALFQTLQEWCAALEEGRSVPPPPKLELTC